MFDILGHTITPEMAAVVSPYYFEFPPHYVSSHFKTVIATVTAMENSTVFQ
jgi:dihydrodipicolinate synthase/N-acetylneuraminate lyase